MWEIELETYGKVKKCNNPAFIPLRFQGQYEDVETGLYYNRFRYYAPEEGMYVSQDPIWLAGGRNFYGYVYDINSTVDILGLIIVYRALNGAQEASALAGVPIQPKNSSANYSIQEHIDNGNLQTQYISTTKNQRLQNFMQSQIPKEGK